MHCSKAELTIGMWYLKTKDIAGNKIEIQFYITKGDGVLLLGNQFCSKGD